MELNEAQAKEELRKLPFDELVKMAEEAGKPTGGMSASDLVELLLGNCIGCNKGRMTLTIIAGSVKSIINNKTEQPCVGCGK